MFVPREFCLGLGGLVSLTDWACRDRVNLDLEDSATGGGLIWGSDKIMQLDTKHDI